MFPWMLNDFVLQDCCELKRKIPHQGRSQHNNVFVRCHRQFLTRNCWSVCVLVYINIKYKN